MEKEKQFKIDMKEHSSFKKLSILEKQVPKDITQGQMLVARKLLNFKKA